MTRIFVSILLWLQTLCVLAQLRPDPSPWFSGRQDAYMCTVDDHGRVWIGTANQLYVDDGDSCLVITNPEYPGVPLHLDGSHTSFLNFDDEGKLWISTVGGGLYMLDTNSGQVSNWKVGQSQSAGPLNNNLWKSAKAQGKLYIGGESGGLQVFDPASRKFNAYVLPEPDNSIHRQLVRDIIIDQADSNLLWLATMDGLISFDIPSEKLSFHEFPQEDFYVSHSPHIQGFFSVCQSDDGILWLGTWYDGLHSYDPQSKEWKQFIQNLPVSREPSNNLIYSLSSNDNLLGISSYSLGFRLFDTDLQSFISVPDLTLNEEQYLERNLFNYSFGNKFYIPRPTRSLELKIDDQDSIFDFKPYIRDLRIEGERDQHYSLFMPEEIEVDFDDDIFIEFGSTELFDQQVELDFRLNEGEWTAVRPFDPIHLSDLHATEFKIDLRYRWNSEEWKTLSSEINFIVHRKWYSYPWLWVLASLVVVAGLYSWITSLKKKKRKQEEREEMFKRRLAEVQMEALRSQMNPHFLFNSLNSIKDFIIRNEQKDAVDYLQKFSELIRAILENSKAERISLANELESVKLYVDMETLRFGGKIHLQLDLERCQRSNQIMVPPLIIQPYVENSILHGLVPKNDGGSIRICCEERNAELIIYIEDNGIGRKAAKERKQRNLLNKSSMGMDITRERIGLVSASVNYESSVEIEDLYDEAGNATGTLIKLTLPLELKRNQNG